MAKRRAALGLLVAFAAALRFVAWSRSGAIFDDGPVFLYLAEAIRDGDFAAALRHPYHPGYPTAVALASLAAPSFESAGALVSIAAGALAVALVHVLVREMFDATSAWVAAALVALHPPSVAFSSDVQSEGLYTALFLASAIAAWRGLRGARRRDAGIAGALAGAAYLVRPEGLGIALAGIAGGAWLGLVGSWGRRGALAWCASFALGALVVSSVYAVALREVDGEFELTRKKSVAALAGFEPSEARRPSAAPAAPPIPSNGPLPGTRLAALAAEPAPPTERTGDALAELYGASASALRLEIASFLALGLFAARGRPGRRALFVGAATAIYAAVLFALGATAGYVSTRHALPPLLLSFGYLALGARALGELALGALARVVPSNARRALLDRRGTLGAALAVAVAAALFLPRDVAARRLDRVAERRAAEWVAATTPVNDTGAVVAARRIREAWYAGATFVPIPARGYAAPALLDHLRSSGVRYVVIDAERVDAHEGLRGAIETGMRRVHSEFAHGREAWVFELDPSASGAGAAAAVEDAEGTSGAVPTQ